MKYSDDAECVVKMFVQTVYNRKPSHRLHPGRPLVDLLKIAVLFSAAGMRERLAVKYMVDLVCNHSDELAMTSDEIEEMVVRAWYRATGGHRSRGWRGGFVVKWSVGLGKRLSPNE